MRFWERIEPAPVTLNDNDEDRIEYTFNIIPSQGAYADQKLEYHVTFEKEENVPPMGLLWEFDEDLIDEFPEDQVDLIDDIQAKLEKSGSQRGLTLWTVLFFVVIETGDEWEDPVHYELLNLNDPEAAIKVMRTIEATVTAFIEKYHTIIDAVAFSADVIDHGRNTLYARYTKILEKQLGWKSLIGLDTFQKSRIFISYDENALKAL